MLLPRWDFLVVVLNRNYWIFVVVNNRKVTQMSAGDVFQWTPSSICDVIAVCCWMSIPERGEEKDEVMPIPDAKNSTFVCDVIFSQWAPSAPQWRARGHAPFVRHHQFGQGSRQFDGDGWAAIILCAEREGGEMSPAPTVLVSLVRLTLQLQSFELLLLDSF